MEDQTTLHLEHWAASMRADVAAAVESVSISALSLQPPMTKSPGEWPDLWHALVAAAARGLTVRLYLPAPTATHPATRFNEAVAKKAADAGIRCHLIRGPRLLHCKSLVIDNRIVWIGSGNFTAAACHHNLEAYSRTHARSFAATVQARWDALA